jgi:cyclase
VLRYRIIPVLLLKDKKLVKTKRFKNPVYIGDPINAIKIFCDYGADELIVLNIDRTPPDADFIQHIADECSIPFAYGGGIRTVDDFKTVITAGAEKCVIRTYTDIIPECAKQFGSQSIVLCIDYGGPVFFKKKVTYNGISGMVNGYVGELLLQSIDHDGMMGGYDLPLIREVSGKIGVPLISLGGSGTIEHLREAKQAGADAVAAGSMFIYSGKDKGVLINYPNREEVGI